MPRKMYIRGPLPPLYIFLDIYGQEGCGKEEYKASGVESGRAQLMGRGGGQEGRYTQGGEVKEKDKQEYQEKGNNGYDEKSRLFTTRRAGWMTSTRRIRTMCSPIQAKQDAMHKHYEDEHKEHRETCDVEDGQALGGSTKNSRRITRNITIARRAGVGQRRGGRR